jgi:PadR family transcriptional regulator, regulatory protein PadR
MSISKYDIMSDNVLRHLFTGFVRLHILYHADKEPICGVEIMEELRRHGYVLGPGTLYPILHHLHEEGYLSCKEASLNGKRRKNFRATASGKRLLKRARKQLRELVSEVLEDGDKRTERS